MIICFIAGGFNETYSVFQFCILVLAGAISLISKRHTNDKRSLFFLLSGFVGATLSLLTILIAPGNHFRQANFPPPPPFPNLIAIAINSYWLYFIKITGSIMKILALVGAIAVGGFVGTVTDVRIKSTKIPVFIMLIGLGLIYSCFPPAAYGLSDAPPRIRVAFLFERFHDSVQVRHRPLIGREVLGVQFSKVLLPIVGPRLSAVDPQIERPIIPRARLEPLVHQML